MSCADVGNDAARVGDQSLGSAEFGEWLDDVAQAQPASFLAPSGAASAAAARDLLTRWVSSQILTRVVEAEGGEVTDDDRAQARSQVEAGGAYAGASDESIDRIAAFDAVIIALDRTVELDPAEAEQTYADGTEAAGVVCARAILAETAAEVDAALARVADGEDFGTVADEVNPEGNFGEGGAVLDETGSECIALGQFTAGVAPNVADAIAVSEIGVPTEVLDLGGAFATLVLRPFDEVSEPALRIMSVSASRTAGRAALQSADDVEVASRFGRWDPEQMAVVAPG